MTRHKPFDLAAACRAYAPLAAATLVKIAKTGSTHAAKAAKALQRYGLGHLLEKKDVMR